LESFLLDCDLDLNSPRMWLGPDEACIYYPCF